MAIRKKTTLEKFFSLNHHRKRWGARKFRNVVVDYATLKSNIIDCGQTNVVKAASKSLDIHLDNLRAEFSGKSELLHYHATLIVHIRREADVERNYQLFRDLWDCEAKFLLDNLDIRWLISAADTLADHDCEHQARDVAMMAVLLVNTVKLYETERLIYPANDMQTYPMETVSSLNSLEPLFDGLRCFAVGRDDTLRNMYWRIQSFAHIKPSGQILSEIYDRLQVNDTAFMRFQNLDPIQRTAWWK